MISDVLERCQRCGEDERRADVQDDDRGRWWLIACSPRCSASWRLIVAAIKPVEPSADTGLGREDSLSPIGLRKAILRVEAFALENRKRIESLEEPRADRR